MEVEKDLVLHSQVVEQRNEFPNIYIYTNHKIECLKSFGIPVQVAGDALAIADDLNLLLSGRRVGDVILLHRLAEAYFVNRRVDHQNS